MALNERDRLQLERMKGEKAGLEKANLILNDIQEVMNESRQLLEDDLGRLANVISELEQADSDDGEDVVADAF